MATTKSATTTEPRQLHDDHRRALQAACADCGVTFAVLDEMSSILTQVSLRLPTMRVPVLQGVVSPFGFSLDLADIVRKSGPETQKLRDIAVAMDRR